MLVSMFFDGRAVRWQTFVVMIAFGLAEVVITNAVEEDHQDVHATKNKTAAVSGSTSTPILK